MHRPFVTPFVLVVGLFITSPASPAQILRPRLIIRSYQAAPVTAADWEAARRETASLLDLAGIDVDWLDCTARTGAPQGCASPLKADEVAVRLVRLSRQPPAGPRSLGESLIEPRLGAGTLATIYVDRVEWLARAGGIHTGTLLGRAIAHEVCHLLLGTRAHGTALMRPVWTAADLRRASLVDWQFASGDAARMRAGLERRTRIDTIAWAMD